MIRSLIYLVQTWSEIIVKSGQNIYGNKRVAIPAAELYVIYSGDKKDVPKQLLLSEEFFEGKKLAVEVTVKVISIDNNNRLDIIQQYIAFTKVFDEQVKKYGKTLQAVQETIRICIMQNILKDYLKSRRKEVEMFMYDVFDEEYIMKCYREEARNEGLEQGRDEGRREGRREGREEGRKNAEKKIALTLLKRGDNVADIADVLNIDIPTLERWFRES